MYTRINGNIVTTKSLFNWEEDKLISEEIYDEDGNLDLIFDYKTDDQINPFYMHPAYTDRIENYIKSNITHSSATDNTGLFDPICRMSIHIRI